MNDVSAIQPKRTTSGIGPYAIDMLTTRLYRMHLKLAAQIPDSLPVVY